MRMHERLPLIAAALLTVAGCTGNQSSEFHEFQARDKATKSDSVKVRTQLRKESAGKRDNTDVAGLATALGAGLAAAQRSGGRLPVEAPLPGPRKVDVSINTSSKSNTADAGIGKKLKPITPREVKLLIPENEFQLEGDALRITYDDIDLLKILNMEPVTPNAPKLLPDWLKNLDGKRIRIRGFMKPPPQQTGLRGFMMGRDLGVCCFGRNPKVYDLFPVYMKEGTTTRYIPGRPFDVVGTFQIKPWIEDGHILRIYRIVDAQVVQ